MSRLRETYTAMATNSATPSIGTPITPPIGAIVLIKPNVQPQVFVGWLGRLQMWLYRNI